MQFKFDFDPRIVKFMELLPDPYSEWRESPVSNLTVSDYEPFLMPDGEEAYREAYDSLTNLLDECHVGYMDLVRAVANLEDPIMTIVLGSMVPWRGYNDTGRFSG